MREEKPRKVKIKRGLQYLNFYSDIPTPQYSNPIHIPYDKLNYPQVKCFRRQNFLILNIEQISEYDTHKRYIT